jgi:hypothetical protein
MDDFDYPEDKALAEATNLADLVLWHELEATGDSWGLGPFGDAMRAAHRRAADIIRAALPKDAAAPPAQCSKGHRLVPGSDWYCYRCHSGEQ